MEIPMSRLPVHVLEQVMEMEYDLEHQLIIEQELERLEAGVYVDITPLDDVELKTSNESVTSTFEALANEF